MRRALKKTFILFFLMLASGNHYESWMESKSCRSSLTFTTIKDPTIWQPQISSKVQRRSNEHLSLQVLPFLGVGIIYPLLETEWDIEIKILLKRKRWHVQEMSSSFSFQSGHFHFMNKALEMSFFRSHSLYLYEIPIQHWPNYLPILTPSLFETSLVNKLFVACI